jgi:hypothetical protein
VAINSKLLDYLVSHNSKPKSISEIAANTGIQPLMLGMKILQTAKCYHSQQGLISKTGRLLRYMATVGMAEEISEDSFGPTNITTALTVPGIRAAIGHG